MMRKKNTPAYLINLKRNTSRLKGFLEYASILEGILDINVIEALDGHDIDFPFFVYEQYAKIFWGRRKEQNDFKPGAFCCYLSHAKCWDSFIENTSAKYAYILEDDICVDKERLIELDSTVFPDDFDVIFINERVHSWLNYIDIKSNVFTNVSPVVHKIAISNDFKNIIPDGGVGTDAYIVSRKGALKLLKMRKIRGICMDIDYAIVLNSLSRCHIESIVSSKEEVPVVLSLFLEKLEISGTSIEDILLNSYVYNNKPIFLSKHISSDINHTKFLPRAIFKKAPKNF